MPKWAVIFIEIITSSVYRVPSPSNSIHFPADFPNSARFRTGFSSSDSLYEGCSSFLCLKPGLLNSNSLRWVPRLVAVTSRVFLFLAFSTSLPLYLSVRVSRRVAIPRLSSIFTFCLRFDEFLATFKRGSSFEFQLSFSRSNFVAIIASDSLVISQYYIVHVLAYDESRATNFQIWLCHDFATFYHLLHDITSIGN